MNFHTDLALERQEISGAQSINGISTETENFEKVKVTRITVDTDEGAQMLSKPKGKYVTVHMPSFSLGNELDKDELAILTKEISSFLPDDGTVLVAGLGNMQITPDALGPKVTSHILATRHIFRELARIPGLENLRPVASVSPGVLGQTGIETGEIIRGVTDNIKPSAVIVIDALASRSLSHLGTTIQICDTGISPGSGVGNKRKRIDESTLGTKVISIGIPTVVDAVTLATDIAEKSGNSPDCFLPESEKMMVTPKEIDLLIEHASKFLSMAINCALQPSVSPEDIFSLVS